VLVFLGILAVLEFSAGRDGLFFLPDQAMGGLALDNYEFCSLASRMF